MPAHQPHPVHILLVEDNDGDALLTEEALADSKMLLDMNRVRDGVEALAYLRKEPPFTSVTSPDLILLDLNMPRMGGQELLSIVKQDPKLKRIPVVVLTTSDAERDIVKSYELHASCYISKPVDFTQFQSLVQDLSSFWFTVVQLPPDTDTER